MKKQRKIKPLLNKPSNNCKMPLIPKLHIAYLISKKMRSVLIPIENDDEIGVVFENGWVIVRTALGVKFVCKEKEFISLWK